MQVDVQQMYQQRFNTEEQTKKNEMWKVLCDHFFSRYVKKSDAVLDIAAGYCEFINNISAGKKFAVDINSDVEKYASPDVTTYVQSSSKMDSIADESMDVVFASNFFEHINDKNVILDILRECFRILKRGGRLLILQPNIRYVYKEYWNFFDHHTPLSDKSLVEAVSLAGSTPGGGGVALTRIIPRFLPYSTKGKLPVNPFLIKLYLYMPLAWRFLGKQAFVVATKN